MIHEDCAIFFFSATVITVQHGRCEVGDVVKISSPSHGRIASQTTKDTGCGSEDSPWMLEAGPGQNILIKLIDFAHDESRSVQQQVCLVYATAKVNESAPSNLTRLILALFYGTHCSLDVKSPLFLYPRIIPVNRFTRLVGYINGQMIAI